MKRTLFYALFLLACGLSAQQHISFTYDAAGNRIKRELVLGAFRREGPAPDTASLADRLGASRLSISPNPTAAHVTVQLDAAEPARPVEYTLMSLAGTVLQHRTGAEPQQRFELGAYTAGVYLLRIRQGSDEVVWRIVRE